MPLLVLLSKYVLRRGIKTDEKTLRKSLDLLHNPALRGKVDDFGAHFFAAAKTYPKGVGEAAAKKWAPKARF